MRVLRLLFHAPTGKSNSGGCFLEVEGKARPGRRTTGWKDDSRSRLDGGKEWQMKDQEMNAAVTRVS